MSLGTTSNSAGAAIFNWIAGPPLAIILGIVCIAGAIYLSKDSGAGRVVQTHIAKLGAVKSAAEIAA
jgi:hypothetical protein